MGSREAIAEAVTKRSEALDTLDAFELKLGHLAPALGALSHQLEELSERNRRYEADGFTFHGEDGIQVRCLVSEPGVTRTDKVVITPATIREIVTLLHKRTEALATFKEATTFLTDNNVRLS